MEKIVIFNANNENMSVEVVRYFADGDNKYFVFSLHEVDAQGHMNIYVTKINNQNGTLLGTNIIDDVEWSNLKTNLQRIIKENRTNGNAVVNDLPYNELQNVKVADRRALKLLAASVDMLNLGYNPSMNEVLSEQAQVVENGFAQPIVENVQNVAPVAPDMVTNNMGIFENNPQPVQNPVQNNINQMAIEQQPIQNVPIQQPINPQPVQNPVNNSMSADYKDLYFAEKENTNRLTEENNRLITELNNCKLMISDIKNILSRQ